MEKREGVRKDGGKEGRRENGGLPARKTLKVYGEKSCGLFLTKEQESSPAVRQEPEEGQGAREEMLTAS